MKKPKLALIAAVLVAAALVTNLSAAPAAISLVKISAAASASVSAAPEYKSEPKGPRMANLSDSLSYAFGTDVGRYAKDFRKTSGMKLDLDMFFAAIKDGMDGKPAMTPEETSGFLQEYFSVRLPADNLRKAEAFLKVTAKKHTVQKTDSGLLYEIIRQGDMSVRATQDSDTVVVGYVGTLQDGTHFDSNTETSFVLSNVIRGWTEGMKLVGKGGKIRLYLHPELGYGERGTGGTIPPNSALVFEVELMDVNPPTDEEHDY